MTDNIAYHGQLDAGEEIHVDADEEGDVLLQEFWQIDIHNGTQHNLRLRQVSIKPSQRCGGQQNGLYGAHSCQIKVQCYFSKYNLQ